MSVNVGTKIKEAMEAVNLTAEKLAERVNKPDSYIANNVADPVSHINDIMENKAIPGLGTLFDIAKEVGKEPKELVKEDPVFQELGKVAKEHGIKQILDDLINCW